MDLQKLIISEGPLGDVAFGDKDNPAQLAKLQNKKPGSEKNTTPENKLAGLLYKWTTDSRGAATDLWKFKDVIMSSKKDYPQIFKPDTPNGTVVYRGLADLNPATMKILRSSEFGDWKAINGGKYMLYLHDVKYSPRRTVQSFTTDLNIAAKTFAKHALIITKQNDEFAMSQKAMRVFFDISDGTGGENEKEILHFGKDFSNKVFIAVDEEVFNWEIKKYILGKSKLKLKDLGSVLYNN